MFSGNASGAGGDDLGVSGIISGMIRINDTSPYSSAHFVSLNAFGFGAGPKINGADYLLVTGQADCNSPFSDGLIYKNGSEFFYLNQGYWGPGIAMNLNTGAWTASPSMPGLNAYWRSGASRIDGTGWSSQISYVDNPTWSTITSMSWTDTGVGEGYLNGLGTLSNGYSFRIGGNSTFEYPAGTFYYGYTKAIYKTSATGSYSAGGSFTGTNGSTTGSGVPGNNSTKFYHWNTNGSLYTIVSGSSTHVGSTTGFNNTSYNKTRYIPSWDIKNNRFIQLNGSTVTASTNGLTWSSIGTYPGVGNAMSVRALSNGKYLWFGYSGSTIYVYYCNSSFTILDSKSFSVGGNVNTYEFAIGQPGLKDYNATNWTW